MVRSIGGMVAPMTWWGVSDLVVVPDMMVVVVNNVSVILALIMVTTQNRVVFDSSPPRRAVIFDDIVATSFIWSVNRCSCSFSFFGGLVAEVAAVPDGLVAVVRMASTSFFL
nr:RNA-directed DNA polymerase, eukaryota [Tanacetum cinerariifolium]